MWFLGHTALAFGFAAAIVALGRRSLRSPEAFALAAFFANLIDFFHLEQTRPLSHNLPAAIAMPVVAILIWRRWTRWSAVDSLALLGASAGGIVGDLAFGPFYPFAPVSWEPVQWAPIGGSLQLALEALSGMTLLALFTWGGGHAAGAAVLRSFRGPWWMSPAVAAFFVAVLWWGECAVFFGLYFVLAPSREPLALADFALIVAVALVYTRWFVAAGGAWLLERARAAVG